MPIYFKPSLQELPLTVDSFGNRWHQEPIHRPRGYPLYHWLQTESGSGAVTLPDTKIILEPGEGVLIAPHTPHSYRQAAPACRAGGAEAARDAGSCGGWVTSFLTFGGTLAGHIGGICGASPWILISGRDGAFFQEWIDRTVAAYLDNTLDDLRLSSGCYEFLLHISGIYPDAVPTDHPLYLRYVYPVMKRIETGYGGDLDVDSLSLDIHVTPQYLTRLFRRFTGDSVQSYIARIRISKAKELLIEKPFLKVQTVSHLCGYSDVSHFIAVFRRHTGATPRQFRLSYGISGAGGGG